MGEKRGERDFLRGEREAGQEFKAGEGAFREICDLILSIQIFS